MYKHWMPNLVWNGEEAAIQATKPQASILWLVIQPYQNICLTTFNGFSLNAFFIIFVYTIYFLRPQNTNMLGPKF